MTDHTLNNRLELAVPIRPMEGVRDDATMSWTEDGRKKTWDCEIEGEDDLDPIITFREVPGSMLDKFFDDGWRPKRVRLSSDCFTDTTTFIATQSERAMTDETMNITGEFDVEQAKRPGKELQDS
ncbi:hypothetical protein [Halococcus saccharolyticus]|uniref:Uncharacterized protein n=1 Tax=Halococcus saccharolyticus DSM 5350 TaxID=1227455 RepID=M0MT33_9EURY|nr:hypothetical protein [Halococcus saccharolyticus]EMA47615.1 hypothetical protein C449_01092 [Halococcus saccharolyticus DSM 5350]